MVLMGDSGKTRATVVGVLSIGAPCCEKVLNVRANHEPRVALPDEYSRVVLNLDWILSVVNRQPKAML